MGQSQSQPKPADLMVDVSIKVRATFPLAACEIDNRVADLGAHWLRAIREPGDCSVFDIDHTLLNGSSKPIAPLARLLRESLALGVPVFLITARSEEARAVTERQLAKAGIGGHSELFMFGPDLRVGANWYSVAGREKQRMRSVLEGRGLRIVLNAGDAPTDHYPHRSRPDIEDLPHPSLAWVDGCTLHLKPRHR